MTAEREKSDAAFEKRFVDGGFQYSQSNKDNARAWWWDGWQARMVLRGWKCFHCNEVFTKWTEARQHFGVSQDQIPACQIDVKAFRQMEYHAKRHAEEDTDLHLQINGMRAVHEAALRTAEEEGYAKGLRDAKREASPREWPKGLLNALKGCTACEYDEAEGELFRHCDECCLKVTRAAWAMVHEAVPPAVWLHPDGGSYEQMSASAKLKIDEGPWLGPYVVYRDASGVYITNPERWEKRFTPWRAA